MPFVFPFGPRRSDSSNNLLSKAAQALAVALGDYGVDVFTVGGPHTGNWQVLHALEATVATVIRSDTSSVVNLAAGDRVYGRISSVTVTSGSVEVYRNPQWPVQLQLQLLIVPTVLGGAALPIPKNYLLKEDGDFILQENGDRILLET